MDTKEYLKRNALAIARLIFDLLRWLFFLSDAAQAYGA
jgi:hypothetical protein